MLSLVNLSYCWNAHDFGQLLYQVSFLCKGSWVFAKAGCENLFVLLDVGLNLAICVVQSIKDIQQHYADFYMATWQDILIALKCCLKDDAAMAFAMNVSGKLHLPLEAPIVIAFHYCNAICLKCQHLQQSTYIITQTRNWYLFIKQAIRWGQLPSEERALLQAERQVKFLNHV